MTQKKADLLLAVLVIMRSTSFLFNRIGLAHFNLNNLMALRYLIAFFLLSILFGRRLLHLKRRTAAKSFILSLVFFLVMSMELHGLALTDSATTSFLENTAIIIVPFGTAFLNGRLPDRFALRNALIAMIGVGLLTLTRGSSGSLPGIFYCMAAAFFYAGFIILTGRLSGDDDVLEIGILENAFLGVFALLASSFTGGIRLPSQPVEWALILGLALVCSAFGLTLQPLAQKYTTAERAGNICAFSPLSSSILSALFLREIPGLPGIFGALLILVSVLLPAKPISICRSAYGGST